MSKQQLLNNMANDDGNITISKKAVKWILSILSSAIIGLGSLAWGLYSNVDSKVTKTKDELVNEMEKSHDKIMKQLEKMEDVDIKENRTKNYEQDTEIGILIERTNSKNQSINHNSVRPDDSNHNLPD